MDQNLCTKIAYWYYILGLTQDEIAKRLGFTRQKVNQIINGLKDQNIVHITIRGFEEDNVALEARIENIFGLQRCVVVSDYGEPETAAIKVAVAAAQYLEKIIKNGDTVGVSWGRTLARIAEQFQFCRKPDCKVVSLLGALNMSKQISKAHEVARSFANKLDCPSVMLNAPLIVEHPETKAWLMREKHIRQSFEFMQQCTVAVLGIGTLTAETSLYGREVVTAKELQALQAAGFVGDLATNLVRENGSWDANPLSNRILAADMDCLRRIGNVVAVTAGVERVAAIRAALRSGCIDTLILDQTTAQNLLEHAC